MNVCIDIQPAVNQTAGIGRYTRRLVEHLGPLARAEGLQLRLFYFDFRRNALAPPSVPGTVLQPYRTVPGRWVQAYWRRISYPDFTALAGPADLYHFPNFLLPPVRRGRSVVTIHDMSFVRFPQFSERRNLQRLTAAIPRSASRADAIITISHFSAAEIADALSVDPGRIHVTHPGVESCFHPADDAAISAMRRTLGLHRPYLLTVGTLEPRKNHVFLAEVFELLEGKFDGVLAIAGAPGWQVETIMERLRRSSRADAIRILSHVPESLLPALYSGAEIFLFPSFYEGFGFPPLEALACGTPVVSSDGGALAEILDTQAVMRPGEFNAEAWAAAVCALLREDTPQKQSRRAAGRQHAARYRWTDTARQTWRIYRSVYS